MRNIVSDPIPMSDPAVPANGARFLHDGKPVKALWREAMKPIPRWEEIDGAIVTDGRYVDFIINPVLNNLARGMSIKIDDTRFVRDEAGKLWRILLQDLSHQAGSHDAKSMPPLREMSDLTKNLAEDAVGGRVEMFSEVLKSMDCSMEEQPFDDLVGVPAEIRDAKIKAMEDMLEGIALRARSDVEWFRTKTEKYLSKPRQAGGYDVCVYKGRYYTQDAITDLSCPLVPIGGGDTVRLTLSHLMVEAYEGNVLKFRHRYQIGMKVSTGYLTKPFGVYQGRLIWSTTGGLFVEAEAQDLYSSPNCSELPPESVARIEKEIEVG